MNYRENFTRPVVLPSSRHASVSVLSHSRFPWLGLLLSFVDGSRGAVSRVLCVLVSVVIPS